MSRYLFRTQNGELVMPLESLPISRCIVDAAISLVALVDSDAITLRIEGPFVLTEEDGSHAIDPNAPRTLGPAVALVGATVRRARASETGRLELVFEDGRSILVEPSDEFEAWEISGPRDAKAVCRVDGGVSTWGARS